MSLLLDTHIFLWWLADDRRLADRTRRTIATAPTVWVSAASIWEIAIKLRLGKLKLDDADVDRLAELTEACGFSPLGISQEHAAAVRLLPTHHADPFDRMLIAQAQFDGLRIVTADDQLDPYDVELIPAV